MSLKIAITSGKGGTGKTTVSTALFYFLSKYLKYNVQLVDCDVEEPNCQIFLNANKSSGIPVNINIPKIDTEKCTFCGECKRICAFNAIVLLPSAKFIELVDDMCHACGACSYVCPEKAIEEVPKHIGDITLHRYHATNDFIEGRMNVGIALQTRVVRETIQHANNHKIVLFDSPPGTSCPVVAIVSKSDYVVMVTEPSPFGFHDLKLMIKTVRQLGIKHGVIINKAGLRYKLLYEYIERENIPLLGEIPFNTKYAMAYSEGKILPEYDPYLVKSFKKISNLIMNEETV